MFNEQFIRDFFGMPQQGEKPGIDADVDAFMRSIVLKYGHMRVPKDGKAWRKGFSLKQSGRRYKVTIILEEEKDAGKRN